MNRAITALAALALAGAAHAQTYPTKPVKLVVPFAPGGSSEIVARSIAAEMSKGLGQSVYRREQARRRRQHRDGGGRARRARPHTLILGHIGTLAVNPYIFDKLPYDADKDFAPISLLAKVPSLFVVNPERAGEEPEGVRRARQVEARQAQPTARRATAAPAISPSST